MRLDSIDLVREGRCAFFVGSGVSCASPTFIDSGAQVLHALCSALAPDGECGERFLELATTRLRFEVLLYYVEQCFGSEILEYFGTRLLPNAHHVFLAEAIDVGHPVVTTNFDRCIEAACQTLDIDPPVLIGPGDFERMLGSDGYLAKLHGCVSERWTIQATTTGIATMGAGWRTDEPKTQFLRRLAREHVLVVMGYSGSDDFDINPALENANPRGVVWVDHRPGQLLEARIEGGEQLREVFGDQPPGLLVRLVLASPQCRILVLRGDTGAVCDRIAEEVGISSVAMAKDESPRRYTFADYIRSRGFHEPRLEGLRQLVGAMVFDHFGEHRWMRAALESVPSELQPSVAAHRELLLGRAAAGLGDLEEARGHFDESVRLAQECEVSQIVGEARIELGRVDAARGDEVRAEELFVQAMCQLGGLGTQRGACEAMMELAKLYHQQGRTEECVEAIESALGYAVEEGRLDIEYHANDLFIQMGHDVGRSAEENRRILNLLVARL